MAFIRLCDNYIDHPKFRTISDKAFRLWHEAMAYCRRYLTDGFVEDPIVREFRSYSKPAFDQLTSGRSPLWENVEGGIKVHDYLDWNPSKDVEQRRLTEARQRTSRWRDASRDASQHVSRDASGDSYVPVRLGTSISKQESQRRIPARPKSYGRISLHPWQEQELLDRLGAHAEAFDLVAWLFDLSAKGVVFSDRNAMWAWVQKEFAARCQQLGMPMAGGESDAAPNLDKIRAEIARQVAGERR